MTQPRQLSRQLRREAATAVSLVSSMLLLPEATRAVWSLLGRR